MTACCVFKRWIAADSLIDFRRWIASACCVFRRWIASACCVFRRWIAVASPDFRRWIASACCVFRRWIAAACCVFRRWIAVASPDFRRIVAAEVFGLDDSGDSAIGGGGGDVLMAVHVIALLVASDEQAAWPNLPRVVDDARNFSLQRIGGRVSQQLGHRAGRH